MVVKYLSEGGQGNGDLNIKDRYHIDMISNDKIGILDDQEQEERIFVWKV